MVLQVSVYFLFYSTKDLVDLPVVFFVVAADLADECNDHSETASDASNHNLSRHVMLDLATVEADLALQTRLAFRRIGNQCRQKCLDSFRCNWCVGIAYQIVRRNKLPNLGHLLFRRCHG
jgi:hypothetical protein